MLEAGPLPGRLCFAHHGMFTGDAKALLMHARQQLQLWVAVVGETLGIAEVKATDKAAVQQLIPEIIKQLNLADHFYARGKELPQDIRQREEDFTRQTLMGIIGYLAGCL